MMNLHPRQWLEWLTGTSRLPTVADPSEPRLILPDFVIIGAMKCGTTGLFHHLRKHRGIVGSKNKETNFFTRHYDKGLPFYTQKFEGTDKQFFFEASPNYTKRHLYPHTAQRMHATLPNAKLIYLMRDPIDRAMSHYRHNFAAGREKRPYSKAFNRPNYVKTSQYHYQLEAYLQFYPRDQILLVSAEQLWNNPGDVLPGILKFVGIRPSSSSRRSAQLLPMHSSKNKKVQPAKTQLNSRQYRVLRKALEPDVAKLREFSGMPFAEWSL